ncbi:thioredoxin fold domain-containing protein [Marinomonas mediterranea]|jgi:Protein-disulfide isomerase|uniref:Thiol:disulfide interchange protein n=1 Tax=Marinomonas mediterranea (strain ATCC 700492 / JCM 21426 / NBRC 103028 / MMB-1) TaxID=717774 RepID=F2K1X9_MARM1|nr:thioredoxin fold domain-containing protein [Marinomonas mediterranea]ADZ89973.1 disulfide bond isomerase, DsbC/G [Marinomonas mediterranea MMB-1]WCN08040.1 thioredoxin fold domain-containing protein [Marinomonas mediterranea]WCN12135.1 thioredoxin fold domain-containing protein [Marinomonas mediterranea]WCN16182.1 thioredoxin fold domain-containing protein [Marinomonas mediterranea MMB-1]
MKIRYIFGLLTLSLTLLAQSAFAGQEEIEKALQKAIPGAKIGSISEHSSAGLYVVSIENGPTLHVTKDGKYFVLGDLYRVEDSGLVNETENAKMAKVEAMPEDQMIVFKAKDEKAHITVFTDVDCGYCRMLHREVDQLNDLGITVRYMAYPRAGIGSPAYNTMVSIWCSDNPKYWMTQAKQGEEVPQNKCENPVADQFNLGNSVGVRGTPSIVLSNGKFMPGYIEANRLAAELGL